MRHTRWVLSEFFYFPRWNVTQYKTVIKITTNKNNKSEFYQHLSF